MGPSVQPGPSTTVTAGQLPVQERISPCRQFSVFRGPERNYAIGACAVEMAARRAAQKRCEEILMRHPLVYGAPTRSDRKSTLVSKKGRFAPGVHEDNIIFGPPSTGSYQRDESSEPFAGVNRIDSQGFQRARKPDRLEGCVM